MSDQTTTTEPDELDDLDRRLGQAYAAFATDHPVAAGPPTDLGRAIVRVRHRDRRGRVLTAAAVCLVLVVLGAALARQRSASDGLDVSSTTAPTSEVVLPDTPLRWFGFDLAQTPELSIWSAYTATIPRRQPATFVAELHAGGDWRAAPAASVVVLDTPYGEVLPTATDAPAPGGEVVRNGDVATMVRALDEGRTLRVTAVGLDDDAVRALGEQAPTVASGQPWPSLPADLQVVQLRRDRIEAAEAGALFYIDRTPLDRNSSNNLVEVRFTEDPVEMAEEAVGRGAGGWPSSTVAGLDASVLAPTPGMFSGSSDLVVWRDGARQFSVRRTSSSPLRGEEAERWRQALRLFPPAEIDALVVGRAALLPSAPGYAPRMGYQEPPGAEERIDTFLANLPATIVARGGDQPGESALGVTGADPSSNNVISLSLVPTTTAERTAGPDPWLVRDTGTDRTIAWLSPSGWSYQLVAYSKDRPDPPLTFDQMVALLRLVDAAGT